MIRAFAAGALLLAAVAALAAPAAYAATENPDVAQLTAEVNTLSHNPVLGQYAIGEQTLARNAIAALAHAGRRERAHALFMAKQRVALAEAAAQVDADRVKLDQLQREHIQIMLEATQAEAAIARAELARQRLRYTAAVQEVQTLQQEDAEASLQAQQAQLEATQAKRLAAAQARAAALARKEARLAVAVTRALRSVGAATPTAGENTTAGEGSSASLQLAAGAFAANSANLTVSGHRRLAEFARAHASQRIVIQPQGSSSTQSLARHRAVAVEAALAAAGATEITVTPVAPSARGVDGVEVHVKR